jgi:DNA transposition AAA+ family ATPase
MTAADGIVKRDGAGSTAALRNVTLFLELVARLQDRGAHLPGIGCFYGPSGFGKTWAATFGANRSGAYYVECGASWAASTLIDAVHHELAGHAVKGTLAQRTETCIQILAEDTRPLIIDEADFLIRKTMVDIVREISDKSSAPIVLIGEEELPWKLMPFERAHNRVLEWVAAVPCDLADARALARVYACGLDVGEDLLSHVVERTEGCTRRVVINLDRIRAWALERGKGRVTLADWTAEVIYAGQPPARRRRVKA